MAEVTDVQHEELDGPGGHFYLASYLFGLGHQTFETRCDLWNTFFLPHFFLKKLYAGFQVSKHTRKGNLLSLQGC